MITRMGVVIGITLLGLAALLFLVVQKGWIDNSILQTLTNIAGIVALLASVAVLIFPQRTPVDSNLKNVPDLSRENKSKNVVTQQSTDKSSEILVIPQKNKDEKKKKVVYGRPTIYLIENELIEDERTFSFLVDTKDIGSIGFECALIKAVGGFIEVDGNRIYTGRDMRRVFSHEVNFKVTLGKHLIKIGFDDRVHVQYVKIFGITEVIGLRLLKH